MASAVLEEASRNAHKAYPYSKVVWMLVRLDLAQIYRQVGRVVEAAEIEAEVRGLFALGDPRTFELYLESARRRGSKVRDAVQNPL